ncbi:MAG: hypothetical protein DUW69_001642 [Verrucomicrobia bacterium]|nr:MAG: hypothetical protein DUW69_001642 [Verrucomicrobiota bacterium]
MELTPRRRRWLIAGIAFFGVFTVTGFFILPPIVKAQAEQRISAELGRKVTIGKIRMNPYAVSITIEQLNIELKDGTGSFLGWDRLYVNVDVLGSMLGEWVLSDIELDGAHLGVEILPNGALNFSDVIAKVTALAAVTPGAPPPKPLRPIRVGRLKVNSARLEFKDLSRAKPFATVLGPVTLPCPSSAQWVRAARPTSSRQPRKRARNSLGPARWPPIRLNRTASSPSSISFSRNTHLTWRTGSWPT